jgi:hypothetical protein
MIEPLIKKTHTHVHPHQTSTYLVFFWSDPDRADQKAGQFSPHKASRPQAHAGAVGVLPALPDIREGTCVVDCIWLMRGLSVHVIVPSFAFCPKIYFCRFV